MKKNHFLFYCILFFINIAYAQFDFTQNIVIDDTFGESNPSKVVVADIDGDGFKDVVSLANNLVWYKNIDGLGNFGKPIFIDEINMYSLSFDVEAADIDGDGDIDLVYFDRGTQDPNIPILVWIENLDGQGNFSASQTLLTLDSIARLEIQLIDMEGDGDMDIAYSDYKFIGWMENTDGQANFTNHNLLSLSGNARYDGFYFSDLDGDNRLDLTVDNQSILISYKHNEDNTLASFQTLDTFSYGRYVISGDVDGDTDNDVVTIYLSGADSKIQWYENTNGLGAFANKATITNLPSMATASINSINDIALRDIDGDNVLDIVFSYEGSSTVSWYKNFGSGTFGSEQIITSTATYIKSFSLEDIDNDTFLDIVTSSTGNSQVSWLQNTDGLGGFSDDILISTSANGLSGFAQGDLDRDGDLDLVSVSINDSKLAWYKNVDGLGDFSEKQIIIANSIKAPDDVFITDIENDGDLDIIVKGYMDIFFQESRVSAYINDGNENFTEQIIMDYSGEISHAIIADVDNDYDADMFVVADGVFLYHIENNNDTTFNIDEVVISSIASPITSIEFSDFDNDNDIDLVLGHSNGNIRLYENSDGLGAYTENQVIVGQGEFLTLVHIQDINKDDKGDIVYVDNANNEIGYMLAIDGLGNFGSKFIAVSGENNFFGLSILDMDNDRDLDIISSTANNNGDSEFFWFENFGDLAFGPSIEIASNIGVIKNHIDAVDLDDDTSLDLLSAFSGDALVWFKNLGLPTNRIQGRVNIDIAQDGCDENDATYANAMIVADNGVNQYATFTQFNGLYQLFPEEAGIYNTAFSTQFPDYFEASPINYSSDLTNLGVTEVLNFCVEQTMQITYDLELSIIPFISDPRPGFESSYRIVYTNKGSLPETGTITFEYESGMMQFNSATEPVINQINDALIFNFENLNPFETRFIDLNFTVFPPPIVNGGDLLDFFATADGGNDDITPVNNSHGIKQFVVNSYDPNDIRVLEGPEIFMEDVDKYLHYVIRFQNTGTASAININVEHQLDEELDWATMQLQSLSHTGRVEIIDGSMVNFIFDDIHLPDSTSNEPASHGHIAYKIKPKSNTQLGDIFSGKADIYFDFNAPIITNTVNTEVVEPLSIDDYSRNEIKLYPNPAKDKIEVASNQIIDGLTIVDINGRELSSIKITTTEYSLDISTLSKGVYFLEIQSGNSKVTKKFIKN